MKLPVWLNKNIFSLGIVSMLNDVGNEITTALLPAFLISLGGTPALLGFIEGTAEVVISIMKLISGWFSDKWLMRKPFATFGYATTAAGIALLSMARGWKVVLAGRTLGRLGKGVREPARDAMLVESSSPPFYTYIFGFHRMMDTLGAIIGPLLALALISFFSMRTVIAFGIIPCIGAVLIMLFVVQEPIEKAPTTSPHFMTSIFELPTHFYIFLSAVGFFSLGNCAVSLFILRATHMTSTSSTYITTFMAVALYSIYNISYAFFSLLMGYAAEHLGTKNVLLIGYLVTTGTLIGFMIDGMNTIHGNALLFISAGLAQACVDTVQKSMAGNLIPEHLHATGYGALAMVTGIGIFCANSGVGLLWTLFSPAWGFGCAALMTFLGTIMLYTIRDL